MDTLTLVLVIIGVVIVWAVAKAIHDGKIFRDQQAQFVTSHKGWDTYASIHNKGLIAINREQGKVVLGLLTKWREYELSQVASVELLRDGASVTMTNRGSQAAGALIGGVALGGVGLLLGGLSGSKRNMTTLHSVALKVIVDDRISPVQVIEFFKSPSKKGTDSRSALLKPALEKADRFHALLVTALRTQPSIPAAPPDTVSELQRLWELKVAGALTDEEFALQKAKLLALTSASSAAALVGSAAEKKDVRLGLIDAGSLKINVIKEVQAITGLGLAEAKHLVESAPTEVLPKVAREEAERFRDRLQAIGATVVLD